MSSNTEPKLGDTATSSSGAPLEPWLGHIKRLTRLLGDAQKHRTRQPSAAQASLAEAIPGTSATPMAWTNLPANAPQRFFRVRVKRSRQS